jgi:tape measure domain-containing protein
VPRRIDTAFVEFLPDFSGFEQAADRELSKVFRDVERTAAHSTDNIEGSFLSLEQDMADVFNDIALSGTIDLERLTSVAERVSAEIGNDFQRSGEVAEAAFTEMRRSAEVDMARLDAAATASTAATSKKFGAMGLASTAALGGIGVAAVAGLGAIATMGLSSAASLEQTQISFDALLGSAEKGQEVFKSLQQFAAVTPFEFPEVAAAAKRFLAFNQQVGLSDDALEGFLTTVGDLSSVTGAGAEGMNRITLAIGQMAGKGKVQLEELMQIGEAVPGFSAVAAIAEQLGITSSEAMAKISAGELDATTGIDALLKGMQAFPGAAGAMEKQSQTLLGVFSTFKDTVGQALADSFAPAIPAIKDSLTTLTPILNDTLRDLAPSLGGILVGLMDAVGPAIKGLGGLITPILNALGPALSQLGPVFEQMGPSFAELGTALAPIVPLLGNFLVAALELAIPLLMLLVPILKLLTPIIQFAADAIGEFAKWLATIDWAEVGSAIGGAFVDAWHATLSFFKNIGKWFSELPDRIKEFVSSIPQRVVAAFQSMADLVLHLIGMWIGGVLFVFTQLPGLLIGAILSLRQRLLVFLGGLLNDAKDLAILRFNEIVDFVKSIPDRLVDGLKVLLFAIPDLLRTAFNNGVDVVSNAINSIVSFVVGLPARIGGFAMDVGSGIVNFIKGALNSAISKVNEGIAAIDNVTPGDLPRIPMLAHGGVAFGPAMIGEDPRTGPEAAIPLGDSRAMAMLREGLGQGTTFEAGAVTVNVNVNGNVTPSQAKTIGQNIGAGLQSVMSGRDITTAVRRA